MMRTSMSELNGTTNEWFGAEFRMVETVSFLFRNMAPSAIICLCDYPEAKAPAVSDDLPNFHTFKYPQERQHFLDIQPIG